MFIKRIDIILLYNNTDTTLKYNITVCNIHDSMLCMWVCMCVSVCICMILYSNIVLLVFLVVISTLVLYDTYDLLRLHIT